jgi:uncharacterized protein
MLGELTITQINQVLQSQVVGRIGCCVDGIPYIVPVTYAFDGKYIYIHSREGRKIKMMRNNPHVCFEIDEIENMANWRSVVVIGRYEELTKEQDQQKALKILQERVMPLLSSETVSHPMDRSHPPQIVEKKKKAIFYRIKVAEKTGRFEKSVR